MAVHVFPIQSVNASLLGGDSIENAYRMARTYLGQRGQSGATNDKYMQCRDRNDVERAIDVFLEWAKNQPALEPKVLWLSLHGKPPGNAAYVGTQGLSAAYNSETTDPTEVVEWFGTLAKLRGDCPPNVVVVSDVCWGASPTGPARLTAHGADNPALFFGPVRTAHRLELDTAAGMIFGLLARGVIPAADEARTVVDSLNACFPPDEANGNQFYRVWWWDRSGQIHRHPDAPEHRFCAAHVISQT